MRCLFVAFALVGAAAVHAEEWPAKPVRLVVPFPPGGAADALPRIVADKLAARWKQPVVIDNRAGASGNIGAEIVFRAEPDGYTLLATPPAPLVINPSLHARMPYDATQFVPVAVLAAIPSVMLAHPKVPATSVQEFVELARARPGRLNYASQGTTTVSFLTTEWFMAAAGGLKITHVPYKGTGPGLAALLAGEVDLMFDNLGVSLAQVRAGRLKALAVCGEKRVAALPGVPAMAEIYPGFISIAWFGVVAPPRTSASVAEQAAAAILEALRDADVQRRLGELSAEPLGMGPAQMASFLGEERSRWQNAIRLAGVKPQE
jgi:tripartite-type tricarboxylate transporter receptor subunit TctC